MCSKCGNIKDDLHRRRFKMRQINILKDIIILVMNSYKFYIDLLP